MYTLLDVKSFFHRDASEVAKDLLGKILCHNVDGYWRRARVVEAEAYYLHEKGSHASLGYTEKRRGLFMPAGTIYMYYSRGKDSFNVSCMGDGNAVLFKSGYAVEVNAPDVLERMRSDNPVISSGGVKERELSRLCSGQTLLCRSLGLKVPDWDGQNFDYNRLMLATDGYTPEKTVVAPRLGIPAGRDEHLALRYVDMKYISYTTNPSSLKQYL